MSDGTFTTAGEFQNQDLATIWDAIKNGGGGGLPTFYDATYIGSTTLGFDVSGSGVVFLNNTIVKSQDVAFFDMIQVKNLTVSIDFNTKTYQQVLGTNGFFALINNDGNGVGSNVNIPVSVSNTDTARNEIVFFSNQCAINSIGTVTVITFPDFYISNKNASVQEIQITLASIGAIGNNALPMIESNVSCAIVCNNSNTQPQ